MVETELVLDTFATATLDANGNGNQINIGPVQPGERWVIKFLSANGSSGGKLQVIKGNQLNAARQLDVTTRPDSDSSNTDIDVQTGERISFWWTGGTPGAVMTCSIQGQRFLRGKRAY